MYQKQSWENLPNKTTPFSKERMEHIEDGIYANSYEINNMGKSAITGFCSVAEITTSSTKVVPITKVHSQKGNKLTVNNGVVKVGAGVSYVIASAQTRWVAGINGQIVSMYICKNESQESQSSIRMMGTYESLYIAPILIPVTEGDTIDVRIRIQTEGAFKTDGDNRATLTVVEI